MQAYNKVMKNKPWYTELVKVIYIIPAFFLGGVIVLIGGALAEIQDSHDTYIGRFILFTIVGGIAWWFWNSMNDSKSDD
jgi:flagellar biosynthesis protein FliQ